MPKSVIFVDSRVTDYQSLIDSFAEPAEVFVLSSDSDGLDQMATDLKGRTGIDAIHVIAHGSQGALYLGSTVLDSGNLALHQNDLAGIGGALTLTGDILLYGCNVAQGDVGLQFINSLAQYTGAEVEASDDPTGADVLGGNWVLEQATGGIETLTLQSFGLTGLFATNTAPTFFAGSGKVKSDFDSLTSSTGNSVIVQTDGKIVLVGTNGIADSADFALTRYNTDGSLDVSFGISGKVKTDFSGNSNDNAYGSALQIDGKILVAGFSGPNFALARYNNNGSLDTSFGLDGKVTTGSAVAGSSLQGYSVTALTSGQVLISGTTGVGEFAVARYNNDGSLDPTFGTSGITKAYVAASLTPTSATVQADGKILVTGSGNGDLVLVRFLSYGALDTSFGTNGIAAVDLGFANSNDIGNSVTTQPDGKILVAGQGYTAQGGFDFALLRLNADGRLDVTFDFDGKAFTTFGSPGNIAYEDEAQAVVVQSDGTILVGGFGNGAGTRDFALARYQPDGSLDNGFGVNGKVSTTFEQYSFDTGYSIALQHDGKILLAGSTGISSLRSEFALVRYNSDGSLDPTFSPPDDTLGTALG